MVTYKNKEEAFMLLLIGMKVTKEQHMDSFSKLKRTGCDYEHYQVKTYTGTNEPC